MEDRLPGRDHDTERGCSQFDARVSRVPRNCRRSRSRTAISHPLGRQLVDVDDLMKLA